MRTAAREEEAARRFKALTDGLLVVRYLFGFRGATLTTGAVDLDCTRCTVVAIESYIAAKV